MKKYIFVLFFPFFLFGIDTSQIAGANSAQAIASSQNQATTTQEVNEAHQNKDQNKDQNNLEAMKSKVFGAYLFSGNFKQNTQHMYNPEYKIAVGDQISLKIWGAVEFQSILVVDSQGNIFIPQVGAVKVLGVANKDLLNIINSSVRKVYKSNVYVYADMNAYQSVSVFVTGAVNSPGLYQGLSSDSVIQYLDKAGGINLEYGSFRDIQVLRDEKVVYSADLYEFLLQGKIGLFAFRTGDVVLVGNVKKYVFVSGEAQKPFRFELKAETNLDQLAIMAGAKPTVTNATIKSYSSDHKLISRSYTKKQFSQVELENGDEIEFRPDHTAQNISVYIEGEHNGLHSLVLKKGTTLKQVVDSLVINEQSDLNSVQVFRKSVAKSQKSLIDAQLKELETLALTAPSANSEGAAMRVNQAKSLLEFIQRAKEVQPKGQIVIENPKVYSSVILEEGDVINIPSKNNLVLVQGEVSLPGAFVYIKDKNLRYYIDLAGDYNSRADLSRVLIISSSGKAEKYGGGFFSSPSIKSGDSILVLPKVDSQNLQIVSMLTQILYQIAIATNVALKI